MFENYSHFLSVSEVCEILMIEKHSVYRLIAEGKVSGIRCGAKTFRISKDSLIKYVLSESGIEITPEEADEYV